MHIFELMFHDLCCLASPELLYLNKSNKNIISGKDRDNDNDALPNNTSVAFSSLPKDKGIGSGMNININDVDINDLESKDSFNDSNMSLSVDATPNHNANDHLVTNLIDNLSTLKLLDVDFKIDYVPILELLETLIANQEYFTSALKYSDGLLHVLHNQLCPLMCEMIAKCNNDSSNISFEGMMRVARLIIELLSRHYSYLEIETDQILSELLRLLEPSNNFPDWAPIIILEILRHLLKNSYLLKFFYIKYDMNSNSDKRVFGSLIHGLGRFLHQTTTNKPKYTSKWSPKRLDNKYFSFIKDPTKPPNDPALQVSLAVLSLISFVEGIYLSMYPSICPFYSECKDKKQRVKQFCFIFHDDI